jgi:hypothetical protein
MNWIKYQGLPEIDKNIIKPPFVKTKYRLSERNRSERLYKSKKLHRMMAVCKNKKFDDDHIGRLKSNTISDTYVIEAL